MVRWLGLMACVLVPSSTGCVSNTIVVLDGEGGESSGETGTAEASTATTADPSTSTGADPTVADTSSSGSEFIPEILDGEFGFECDLWLQDCPPGEKCMPWAVDGGWAWNATRCSPIANEPGGPDDPCMMEGTPTSGLDDCELGTMCWNVDPETLHGTCFPLCLGSEQSPYCEDPDRFCALASDGLILVCLSYCEPLEQDCPSGSACHAIAGGWSCAPDAGQETGGYGDPCSFPTACWPGLVCVGSTDLPPGHPCEGDSGCCTEICDLTDPQCVGAPEGVGCQPWYEPGTAPIGFENVGACALP